MTGWWTHGIRDDFNVTIYFLYPRKLMDIDWCSALRVCW